MDICKLTMLHGDSDGYNAQSIVQRGAALPLLELMNMAVSKLIESGVAAAQHITVMDCGCSQAGLTKELVRTFVTCLGSTRPPIHVVLSDTASNDWTTAFRTMETRMTKV